MKKDRIEKTALKVTRWVGSPQSIVVHTLVFGASFAAVWLHFLPIDRMLLILTTIVSLEAIYLAIFIQMSVNAQTMAIEEVEQDIDEIQEDIDEIQEDVEEMQEDVEEVLESEEEEVARDAAEHKTLEELRAGLTQLIERVEKLQQK
ncbi:DUF1003 domain-containing protein [Candidatus Nomurabacteria bacterium]|nr:DUF1003 domain-containing protein [Candidatus Nomurabacteria bacterium]